MPNILTAAQLLSLLDDEIREWSHIEKGAEALSGFRKKLECIYLKAHPDTVEGATTRLAEAMLGRNMTGLHLMVIDDASKTKIQDFVTQWNDNANANNSMVPEIDDLSLLLMKLIAQ